MKRDRARRECWWPPQQAASGTTLD